MRALESDRIKTTLALLLPLTIVACGGGNNNSGSNIATTPAEAIFRVTVSNLTNAQPLSPVAVVAHSVGFSPFTVGQAATQGLERLAEEGDNSEFLTEAQANSSVLTTESGTAPIAPANSESFDIVVDSSQPGVLQLSVMTMLVNTNDAFSGLNAVDIGALQPQESMTLHSAAYDAGTELDSELAAHIPGPAANGEGFNNARDDETDQVTMHNGVITSDDGLTNSVLIEQHRFDNPVTQITITRLQ